MNDTFSKDVRSLVAAIPSGKVATYGQIAALAGNPRAARAVGSIMRTNKNTLTMPCHRVVSSDGSLRGYAYGSGTLTKKQLLMREGVRVEGMSIDLTTFQWRPK